MCLFGVVCIKWRVAGLRSDSDEEESEEAEGTPVVSVPDAPVDTDAPKKGWFYETFCSGRKSSASTDAAAGSAVGSPEWTYNDELIRCVRSSSL